MSNYEVNHVNWKTLLDAERTFTDEQRTFFLNALLARASVVFPPDVWEEMVFAAIRDARTALLDTPDNPDRSRSQLETSRLSNPTSGGQASSSKGT